MHSAGWLDVVLIALIGSVATIYVSYRLSPVRIQRIMLSWLFRCVGARVYGWLSPRAGGCDQCAGGQAKFSVAARNKNDLSANNQAGNNPNRLTKPSKP